MTFPVKTTLDDIPALARAAAVTVGNDTGPMHMAALTGCPTVAIFYKKVSPARPLRAEIMSASFIKENLASLAVDPVWQTIRKHWRGQTNA